MNDASDKTNKDALKAYVLAVQSTSLGSMGSAIRNFFADGAKISMVHPFNELEDSDAYIQRFLTPLFNSFEHLTRTDYIAFAGSYEGQQWVTCTGYFCGHFARPWLGIQPTHTLAHLRFGEFHRMQDGLAIESYIFLDIPELMILANQWPITDSPGRDRGYTGYLAGPITQDGLVWHETNPSRSASSYEMVTAMLKSLATEDEAWRPYWHNNMMWYGPAAFGSFIGLDNFAGFQVPFENTFSEWIGGSVEGSQTRHFARFADGNYICSGGWPSLNAVQQKPFLGQPASGQRLFMRVCDWWRREENLLVENWVFVDIPHVLLQMNVDIFGDLETQ